jgi:hypothetical protein
VLVHNTNGIDKRRRSVGNGIRRDSLAWRQLVAKLTDNQEIVLLPDGMEVQVEVVRNGRIAELSYTVGGVTTLYPLNQVDAAHYPVDAVDWYNTIGYRLPGGTKRGSPIRLWMLDPNHYTLLPKWVNRKYGAMKENSTYREYEPICETP